ncbi:major facilitator superfamily transporter [Fusarium oxysporum f. sp. phaseoli]
MESSKPSETQSPTFEADYVNKTGVQNNVVIDLQSEEVRRARWKIDLMMLPLLGYSWVASIFYFGYIFWSYPTAFLAARLPIGKYLAGTVIVWAIVPICHGACNNFLGLMITRFFLGAFEAALAPGFSLVMGMWYTRREQPLRYGLIAYAIGHLEGDLPTWRYLFIILGAVTAAWGIFMLVLLPDSPSDAIWLSSAQRETAVYRIQADTQGSSKGSFKMYQALEALQDPVTWFLCLYTFCTNIANGGLTAFGSLVIRGFGYKGLQALLIQMPTGAAQLGFVVISCTLCSLLPNIRTVMMMCLTIISLIDMVLMYALDSTNQSGRLAGFCLSLAFSANMPLAMSLITSNLAGFTKRAVVNACVLIMYSAGTL